MNKKERLATALAISCFVHFALFHSDWTFIYSPSSTSHAVLHLELEQHSGNITHDEGMSLHDQPDNDPTSQLQRKKRIARQQYIEEVQKTIHLNRLQLGYTDIIGIAWYSFLLHKDGSFSAITLEKTSGNKKLDDDAYNAIKVTSKKIPRPAILGNDSFHILVEVKYQYSLY